MMVLRKDSNNNNNNNNNNIVVRRKRMTSGNDRVDIEVEMNSCSCQRSQTED
jgi:hypothetical protein